MSSRFILVSDRLSLFPVAAAEQTKLSMVSRSVPVTAEHVTLHDSGDEAPSLEEDVRMTANFASTRGGRIPPELEMGMMSGAPVLYSNQPALTQWTTEKWP